MVKCAFPLQRECTSQSACSCACVCVCVCVCACARVCVCILEGDLSVPVYLCFYQGLFLGPIQTQAQADFKSQEKPT